MDAVKSVIESVVGKKEPELAPPSEQEVAALKEAYEKHGQGHVFTFYDSLTDSEKSSLISQLRTFKPERITELAEKALNPPKLEGKAEPVIEPLPESSTASLISSSESEINAWYDSGLQQIGAGTVAVVLMAGGQGTRLGSSDPKGCYDVGLPSHKSLFQLQAERILKAQELGAKAAGKPTSEVVIPWYVMTSGPTRKPTEAYFAQHGYFGLHPSNVTFFEQGVLPCISNDGKILLASKSQAAVAPDGNGGIYLALVLSGVLDDMKKRGIQHIHAYCVDNSLVRVADPTFIGFSISKSASLATKVVRKRAANESVGLIISKDGKPDVVEYSEIDSSLAEAKDEQDPSILKFRAANIVNHYYSLEFLDSIPSWVESLPHHVAKKKIPCIDLQSGEEVKPSSPNGVKLEQFVFDIFPRIPLDKFACLEVRREEEFSPLKNAPGAGEDCPETSRADVLAQGKRWLEKAGAVVVEEKEGGVEVSPLVSYGGEGLEGFKGREVRTTAVLEREK